MKKKLLNTKKLTFKKFEISKLNNSQKIKGGHIPDSATDNLACETTVTITTSGWFACPNNDNEKAL